MKKQLLILCILFFSESILAQKVINNPDYIGKNFSADVTKVEIKDTETILHFNMKSPIGSEFLIAKLTYIEDAGVDGKRLYITKSEGVNISQWYTMSESDEIRYKLYFPPLGKGVVKINYGEANPKGHWFVYKLDISKDGEQFLNSFSNNNFNNGWRTVIGYNSPGNIQVYESRAPDSIKIGRHINYSTSLKKNNSYSLPNTSGTHAGSIGNTVVPETLPKEFFGNWYDKYGTLMLIATPDYLVSDSRIQYYQNIQKNGENKFVIKSTSGGFEVLSLDNENMTIRTNKLNTLKKVASNNEVPKSIKGDWLHWGKIKKIKVTDDYFYNDDGGALGVYDVIKSRIVHVVESESGDVIWFVLYHEGNYDLYSARRVDGEYILNPRGFVGAKYKKVKN